MQDAIFSKVFPWLFLFTTAVAFSQESPTVCDASSENPCLVKDTKTAYSSVRLLRDVSMIAVTYGGDIYGINKLFVSASEEPSGIGWGEIAEYLATINQAKDKQVLVLDLRQETHGYLNGIPITLTNRFNWINLGKSNEQSRRDEASWLDELRQKETVSGVLTTAQFKENDFSSGTDIAIDSIVSEEEEVAKLGFKYKRLYISDHQAPHDAEVDEFLQLIQQLPKNTWLHVHCRGGKGRTTTILVMYDMLKNADKVSFDEIIARHASIQPFYNLSEISRTEPVLSPYYEQRIIFLKYFYQYAKQSLQGDAGTWSEWKALNF